MAMGVVNSSQFIVDNLINLATDGFNKCLIFNRSIDGDVLLWFDGIADIDSDDSLSPLFKLGHLLPGELVSVAGNMHSAIIIDHEFRIFITPTIDFEPLLFVSDGLVPFDFLSNEGEGG